MILCVAELVRKTKCMRLFLAWGPGSESRIGLTNSYRTV